jgi:sugar lactone lactonase YvrE
VKSFWYLSVFGLWLAMGFSARAQTYSFTTLAGSAGQSGKLDGTNHAALFDKPEGIAVDAAGNLYVADNSNHTIRKITPNGTNWVVTTIAGTAGKTGGADGTNGAARFWYPVGIAVDAQTNLYVADSHNNMIREIVPSGTNWIVSTIAGSTNGAGYGDGVGSIATFNQPAGLTIDNAGNLFVADSGNHVIRELAPSGTGYIVSTPAGLGTIPGIADGLDTAARFHTPYGVAFGAAGTVLVADTDNGTIRQITPDGSDWMVATIAGSALNFPGYSDGTNGAAVFDYPYGVAADTVSNIFVADTYSDTLRKLTPAGTNWVVTTIGGSPFGTGATDGIGIGAQFYQPYALAVDGAGNLYIADTYNHTIRLGRPVYWLQSSVMAKKLVLSWPSAATNSFLETSSSVGVGAMWTPVTNGVSLSGTNFVWTNTLSAPAFFRLHPR